MGAVHTHLLTRQISLPSLDLYSFIRTRMMGRFSDFPLNCLAFTNRAKLLSIKMATFNFSPEAIVNNSERQAGRQQQHSLVASKSKWKWQQKSMPNNKIDTKRLTPRIQLSLSMHLGERKQF
jgi:hypothetical protein